MVVVIGVIVVVADFILFAVGVVVVVVVDVFVVIPSAENYISEIILNKLQCRNLNTKLMLYMDI